MRSKGRRSGHDGKSANADTPRHAVSIDIFAAKYPWVASLNRLIPRGVGSFAAVGFIGGAICLGILKGGHADEVLSTLGDTRNAAANALGFRITSVSIAGRKQLTQDEVLAIGGVNGRSSLLFLDAATVRDKLKAEPWIAEATVQKFLPGRLQIDIVERRAFALWQQDGRVSVIAEDGAVLQPYVASRFVSLPLVVGKDAAPRAKEFLELLAQFPQIKSAVKAVVYVGERRWNLRMKNGVDVRLPEIDPGAALAKLARFDREDSLLSRDITAIDLRLADRLTVRLTEDAAKARDEALKDKKLKRKAGDA